MKFSVADYVRRHWKGKLSLSLSFWINFFFLYIVLALLERFTFPPYIRAETTPVIALIFFVIVRVMIYPWQIVGVLRACERHIANNTDRAWAVGAQGVVVLSIIATLAATFSSYQSVLRHQRELRATTVEAAPLYSLRIIENDGATLIHLRGPLQVGITRHVAKLLAAHPRVGGIILDSGGGRIYEARGLAKLIKDNALATYALNECASSCTTVFIAGARRTLGVGTKLGFHQYKNYAVMPVIDIDEEQAKDIALFEAQGISSAFLQKIFAQPPDAMWWPEESELLRADVVHATGFSLRMP
ncbi:hypothetical protein [Candidatus Spongiihabitans sp.]|uniref:COG3904 family protein n=1 Tax=Candidatus Spongiihabitans sp. TaxID=3101308 RepID=UPI003C7BBD9B